MKDLYGYFKGLDEEKLSHSYLIGNCNFEFVENDLEKILSEFFFKRKIKITECVDVFLFNIDNNISKDLLKDLLNELSTTSQFNKIKVYVINNFESVSDSVYNAILKTLEEPKEGIYAFLITNNVNSINPTISSRCQKIFISSSVKQDINNENYDLAKKFIQVIENKGIKAIAENYDFYSILSDRNILKDVLINMLQIYNKILRNDYEGELQFVKDKNNNDEIIKKILVINNTINRINNNLNKNLIIDRFIIEMWRCNK